VTQSSTPAPSSLEYEPVAPVPEPPPPEEVAPEDREPAREIEREDFDPFTPKTGGVPAWAKLPKGFKFPRGIRPIFVRFKAAWTRAPHKGDRSCILWELTDVEEYAAAQRATGQPWRSSHEFAKQMLRVIDGHPAEWGTAEEVDGGVDAFWREIGPKCRSMLVAIYAKTHAMEAAERVDFFMSCIEVRPAG
jgi:hypothetical protein